MSKPVKIRRCVACRKNYLKTEMLRVVRTPEGQIKIDSAGDAQGRGAYVCKNENCAAFASKRRCFDKSFKSKVPAEIYEKIITGSKE